LTRADRKTGQRRTVLVAIKGLGIGGAEKLISEGARHWDRQRFAYHVAYALPWKNHLVPDLKAQSIPVHLLSNRRGGFPEVGMTLRRLIGELQADLVHAHLPWMGVAARLVSSAPIVYTEHNMADSYRAATQIANRLTYRRNRAVIAVSDQVAGSLAGYRGPPPLVIPNGVDVQVTDEESASVRAEMAIADEQPLVVHVGNIRPHKGHATLLAAAALLHERLPDAVIVSIGGEKHPGDLERVRRAADELGVSTTVRFLGRRPDAARFIAAADVVVNPSDVEGLPIVVLEAMAVGTPVVATAVGGVPSLIEQERTGLLVDPGDPETLAAALIRIVTDAGLARTISEAAREVAISRYSLEAMVRAHEAVYDEVLGA
jgi:glycosyltransferase involved in cell wall biosynthesis